jgi:formate dehydrogenase subunit gamma
MHKMWRKDMLETDADRAWWKAVDHDIRNQDDQLPPIGRFNYGQKLFFWVMFYGAILLVLSGAVLWFVESIPWSLRRSLRDLGLDAPSALVSADHPEQQPSTAMN